MRQFRRLVFFRHMPKSRSRPASNPSQPAPPPRPAPVDHQAVGARLREARKARELTLVQLSERSGVAVSTISKAERGEIALTYDKFAALAGALQLDLSAVFSPRPAGRMAPAFTAWGGQVVYDTPNYEYGMLAGQLAAKRMVPMLARIHARSVKDFSDYIRHGGEEFVFVLRGSLEVHFEDGRVFALNPGDSLYFDSAVGHTYVSTGKEEAEALTCCVDDASPGTRRRL
jgi:transcriptional regulator with XRE-family HTH domain